MAPARAHVLDRPASAGVKDVYEFQQRVVRHDRNVIRFFRSRRWLLARYNPYRPAATRALGFHRRQLARTLRELRETRRKLALGRSPRAAICSVFGRYCRQALAVARCESGLSTRARNGQYLGLFQMGRFERARYGHGETALAQARAAHHYFVASGRDWSPWQCKPPGWF